MHRKLLPPESQISHTQGRFKILITTNSKNFLIYIGKAFPIFNQLKCSCSILILSMWL